jgi:hypothetical protein
MSSQGIEKILEKYFEGETSLSEERRLREFFHKDDIPSHLVELREQFELYEKEGNHTLPEDFNDILFDEIEKQDRGRKASRRTTLYYISGVAATILILVTIFFRFDAFMSGPRYNDAEAELAFTQATNILHFVSGKFNKGAEPLGKMARFDEGVKNLNTVNKFDEGINKTTPVSRFNQITKLITNPAP